MANENNKIKELVSDDDDPTAELDVSDLRESLSEDADVERESDAHTYGVQSSDRDESAQGQSIPELQQDINRRTKTISRLQYDIQQLHSKWLGLETEIGAREEIVRDLNREVEELRSTVAKKNKRLKKRDKAIKKLESEIADLDEKYEQLVEERTESGQAIEALRSTETEQAEALDSALRDLDNVRSELQASAEHAAKLETDIESRVDEFQSLERQHALVSQELAELRATYADNVAALDRSNSDLKAREAELESAMQQIGTLESDKNALEENRELLQQQNSDLSAQLEEQRSIVAENHAALDTANREIESLGFELEAAQNQAPPDIVLSDLSVSDANDIKAQIARTEEYADSLRHKFQDLTELYSEVTAERDKLNRSLKRMTDQNLALNDDLSVANNSIAELQTAIAEQQEEHQVAISEQEQQHKATLEKLQADHEEKLSTEVAAASTSVADLQTALSEQKSEHEGSFAEREQQHEAELDKLKSDHDDEIRKLRFELGEAQNTITEATDMNTQLASELVNTKESKDDLEKKVDRNEQRSQERITELEKQIKNMTRAAEEFEQKLDTKSTAINVLLGELAKKSEQIDSIGEIEQVIHEIDDRMSGRLDDDSAASEAKSETTPEPEPKSPPKARPEPVEPIHDRERVTRVLVGNIGDQILRFPLFKDRLTIGRTDENDIQLKTSYVSRRHAVILTEGENTRVVDWGSTNGLFVNSRRVKEHFLSNGDIVAVGDAEFRYEERQKRDV